MNEAEKLAALSAFRSVLIALGGVAVGRGWLNPSEVDPLVGALVILAGLAWGVLDKLKKESPDA